MEYLSFFDPLSIFPHLLIQPHSAPHRLTISSRISLVQKSYVPCNQRRFRTKIKYYLTSASERVTQEPVPTQESISFERYYYCLDSPVNRQETNIACRCA